VIDGALTLAEALRVNGHDGTAAPDLYRRSRVVRNALWQGRTPERFCNAMERLHGWNFEHCLA
jgi:3-hydroxybenzoate 6-monooxygenase